MNDDRQIIDQALGIWIAFIVSNPRLLKEIFQDESKQLVPESSFTKILIEDGLLCVNLGVRVLFKNAIKLICESFHLLPAHHADPGVNYRYAG